MKNEDKSTNTILADKIELIRKISNYHPGYRAGTKRGWSTYVGGMRDTGEWNFWKMYDETTISELKECLDELIKESQPLMSPSNESECELRKKRLHEFEKKLLWGT